PQVLPVVDLTVERDDVPVLVRPRPWVGDGLGGAGEVDGGEMLDAEQISGAVLELGLVGPAMARAGQRACRHRRLSLGGCGSEDPEQSMHDRSTTVSRPRGDVRHCWVVRDRGGAKTGREKKMTPGHRLITKCR